MTEFQISARSAIELFAWVTRTALGTIVIQAIMTEHGLRPLIFSSLEQAEAALSLVSDIAHQRGVSLYLVRYCADRVLGCALPSKSYVPIDTGRDRPS